MFHQAGHQTLEPANFNPPRLNRYFSSQRPRRLWNRRKGRRHQWYRHPRATTATMTMTAAIDAVPMPSWHQIEL